MVMNAMRKRPRGDNATTFRLHTFLAVSIFVDVLFVAVAAVDVVLSLLMCRLKFGEAFAKILEFDLKSKKVIGKYRFCPHVRN